MLFDLIVAISILAVVGISGLPALFIILEDRKGRQR